MPINRLTISKKVARFVSGLKVVGQDRFALACGIIACSLLVAFYLYVAGQSFSLTQFIALYATWYVWVALSLTLLLGLIFGASLSVLVAQLRTKQSGYLPLQLA